MKNEIIELTERLQRLEQAFIEHRDNANKNIVQLYDMVQNNDKAMIDMIARIKDAEDYINRPTHTFDSDGFIIPI